MTDFPMIIDGQSVAADRYFDVKNPASGETVGRAPNASTKDLDRAVAAADAAFVGWSQQPDAVRAKACEAIAAKITEHAEELAQLLTREQGKPLNGLGSRFELSGAS
ncbi:MAG TPA: aldehyde dehydrogenase family protein, partial [Rhodoferax sp.]